MNKEIDKPKTAPVDTVEPLVRCATCNHRVARYRCHGAKREWCNALELSTKMEPRAWRDCKGKY